MSKMDPAVKAQWLTALRSGEYQQGRGYLRRNDTFCCIGVLADLAIKAGIGEWMDYPGDDAPGVRMYTADPSNGLVAEGAVLPLPVRNWSRLSRFQVVALGLMEMNDNDEPFERIADVIEKNL